MVGSAAAVGTGASIALASRNSYRSAMQSNDLLLPNEASKFRAFLMCTLTAGMMTILYAGFPLLLLNFLLPLGVWDGWILLIVFVALTLTLFFWSAFETRSLRRLAREL
jgi:hypothetical protein